jgi:hypothetical protein
MDLRGYNDEPFGQSEGDILKEILMRPVRALFLVFALALCFFLVDGGVVSNAAAETCPRYANCRSNYECQISCCTTYGCDMSNPPFCDYLPGYQTCGICFC